MTTRYPLAAAMLTVVLGLVWQGARERGGAAPSGTIVAASPAPDAPAPRMTGVAPLGVAAPPARPAPPFRWPPAPPSKRARRLLVHDDAQAFPPLPAPGPSDWLTHHPEEGQDFEDFRARPRRDVVATRHTLRLQPLDDIATMGVDLAVLAEHLRAYYGLPVHTAEPARPAELTTRTSAQTGRGQILATDVMRWLKGEITNDLVCVLALTIEDLYPAASWNFVFGLASLRDGVGVFSFARMDPAFPASPPDPASRTAEVRAQVLRRCLKVVTHEVGHMFALEHCIERACLMNGSNHAAEMDRAPLHLCPFCLRKVQHATRLDVAERYEALAAFYRRHDLQEDATWVQALLERVPP